MGDRKIQEKITTQLAGKPSSDCRRPTGGETANPTSNTSQTSHHTSGKDRSMEVRVRDSDEPAAQLSPPGLDFEAKHTRECATLFKTSIPKMRYTILLIEEVERKPIKLTLMSRRSGIFGT